MRRISLAVAALGLFALACDRPTPTTPTLQTLRGPLQAEKGGVMHRVSVGGHDFNDPGTNANFSLIALQKADGSVSGEWTDQFGHGDGGVHMEVLCLAVTGNRAWITGRVTHSTTDILPEGSYTFTSVQDNGTSANDPPDAISYTFGPFAAPPNCQLRFNIPLFPMPDGQVKVD